MASPQVFLQQMMANPQFQKLMASPQYKALSPQRQQQWLAQTMQQQALQHQARMHQAIQVQRAQQQHKQQQQKLLQQQQQSHKKPSSSKNTSTLLPPINKYAPRLRKGHTSLIKPVISHDEKRKGRFAEVSSEDSFHSSESENEDEPRKRTRREINASPSHARKDGESYSFLLDVTRRKRLFPTTKHDYERLLGAQAAQAATREVLIPIRIELDLDGFKYRDQFTWNMNGLFF